MALGATFIVANSEKQRTIPADQFFVGYKKVAFNDDEILVAIGKQ
jgi:xanthine dehydrogenase iron-sulfur cluster and FAD-binding subunit A